MIAFDFDLTIADTRQADQSVFAATVENFMGSVPAGFTRKLSEFSGKKLDEILTGLAFPPQQLALAREFFISSYPGIGVPKVKFMQGAEELLAQLSKKSLRFAIVSAKTHNNLLLAVDSLGIKPVECFGGLLGEEKTEILRSLNAKIYVGDQQSDVVSGHNAGCLTVLISSTPEDVEPWATQPDYCYKSLTEIPMHLFEGQ